MGQGPNGFVNQKESDISRGKSICQDIVESLAEAEGTNPIDLNPPLYDVIDPDALGGLFTNDQTLGKVVFNYNCYEVSVFSDGYVSVKSHGT